MLGAPSLKIKFRGWENFGVDVLMPNNSIRLFLAHSYLECNPTYAYVQCTLTHIYSYATCTLTVQSVKVHRTERTPKKTTTEKPYAKLRGINTCHGNVICILYFICASHRQQQSSKMRGFNFWQERNMRLQMCVSLNIQRAMHQVLPIQNATALSSGHQFYWSRAKNVYQYVRF